MEKDCDVCARIKCKRCGWTASDEEAGLVQREVITECPMCSWSPKMDILASKQN